MALADVSPAGAALAPAPFGRVAAIVHAAYANWRADSHRRVALKAILAMPAHRLRDLGISVHDLMQAMDHANGVHRK